MSFILAVGINSFYIQNLNINTLGELTIKQINTLLIYLTTSVMLIYLLKEFFEAVAENVYDKLSQYGQVFIFNITRGDINLQNEIQNRDKNNGKAILIRFFASLIFNIACGIIASLLCQL